GREWCGSRIGGWCGRCGSSAFGEYGRCGELRWLGSECGRLGGIVCERGSRRVVCGCEWFGEC
ncbi:hypothetical protein KGQ20_46930, partial [Catenulispora sp. NF23]|uniref:hypothetical protein n=1 Tax=Catenulispora pinistramenti TaxID=2705254 RepID=UPI001BABDC17